VDSWIFPEVAVIGEGAEDADVVDEEEEEEEDDDVEEEVAEERLRTMKVSGFLVTNMFIVSQRSFVNGSATLLVLYTAH
jgi:hypothetical protein